MTPRAVPPPRLDLLESCWQLQGVTGKTISCGIYAVDGPGVEVRAGYGDDIVRTQRVADVGAAQQLAEAWKTAAVEKGFKEQP